jgi:hypothetical protein
MRGLAVVFRCINYMVNNRLVVCFLRCSYPRATAAASDVNPALNSVSHNERQQFIAFSECSQLDGYKLHGRAHLCGSFLLFSAA